MSWALLVRFLHIISAIVFIGGIFARQLVRSHAKKVDDVHTFATLSQVAGWIETRMVIPGNMVVIILGVILALMTNTPILGFIQGASSNWLLVSNILLLFGFLSVPLVFLPRGKKFDVILEHALAEGRMTPELRAALDDRTVRFLHITEMTLVIVVVVLMVFKPF